MSSQQSNCGSKKKLSNQERQEILNQLLKASDNGKLVRGTIGRIAELFFVSRKTVHRVWKRSQECLANEEIVNVSNKFVGNVGRKRIQIDRSKVLETPLRRRTNIRSMANALNVSKSTLHRRIKEGMLRPHSNALKPSLNNENRKARLRFCLSMLDQNSPNGNPIFQNMYNYVHIDEKWFYMTKESQKYYLLPEEEDPYRTCKSKRFISKVMFLAVVARPRFDYASNEEFSGKIGIFPFTSKVAAKKNSKNRIAGTLETKAMVSVNKDTIRSYLIEKVLPAIKEKWPLDAVTDTIFIQQDNAKPHINPNDVEFLQAVSNTGLDIRLCCQPPNSPDLNVLDLGFFRAIQSLQHQEAPNTIDDLLQAVQNAFYELPVKFLNRNFLTMQQCMIEIMKVSGSNNYRMPHMNKNQLEKDGNLPIRLECERNLMDNVLRVLQELEN